MSNRDLKSMHRINANNVISKGIDPESTAQGVGEGIRIADCRFTTIPYHWPPKTLLV